MFRRSKSESEAATESTASVEKVGGKGRPTPTRKEAEAAARARAKPPRTRKERNQQARALRSESSAKIREGMKAGDEKYLPARDRGPQRRFIRNFVDSRFSLVELMIPILLVTLILGYSGVPALVNLSSTLMFVTFLVVIFDSFMLRRRMRKALADRFPDEPLKGTTFYAITRSMQMRFMRLPKPQVKVGQQI